MSRMLTIYKGKFGKRYPTTQSNSILENGYLLYVHITDIQGEIWQHSNESIVHLRVLHHSFWSLVSKSLIQFYFASLILWPYLALSYDPKCFLFCYLMSSRPFSDYRYLSPQFPDFLIHTRFVSLYYSCVLLNPSISPNLSATPDFTCRVVQK